MGTEIFRAKSAQQFCVHTSSSFYWADAFFPSKCFFPGDESSPRQVYDALMMDECEFLATGTSNLLDAQWAAEVVLSYYISTY